MKTTGRSDGECLPASESEQPQIESPGLQRLKNLVVVPLTSGEPEIAARLIQRPETSGSMGPTQAFSTAPKRCPKAPRDQRNALYPTVSGNRQQADRASDLGPRQQSAGDGNHTSRLGKAAAESHSPNATHQGNENSRASSRASHSAEQTPRNASGETNTTNTGPIGALSAGNSKTIEGQPNKNLPKQPLFAPGQKSISESTGGLPLAPSDERHDAPYPALPEGSSADQGILRVKVTARQEKGLDGATFHEDSSGAQSYMIAPSFCQGSPHGTNRSSADLQLNEVSRHAENQSEGQDEQPLDTDTTPPTSRSRTTAKSKDPLGPVRPSKICKNRKASQRQVAHITPRNAPPALANQTSSAASQEDMFYLLLHRLRQQEQAYSSEVKEREQLQNQKSEVNKELQQCRHQLGQSKVSLNKQTNELRTQKAVIDDIKQSYLKIKSFMQEVYDDKECLRAEAALMVQQQQSLKDENHGIRKDLAEAQDAANRNNDTIVKVTYDLETFRARVTYLQTELEGTKLRLESKRSLVVHTKATNERLENHIQEITRQHHQFALSSQRSQKTVADGLKGIEEKLGDIEADLGIAKVPIDLSALDRCVEMVDGLVQKDTTTTSDVRSMLQALGEIDKRIELAKGQLNGSLKLFMDAQSNSNDQLSSMISREFAALEQRDGQQEMMIHLREAKATLEERVKGLQTVLVEVQNSKESSERREAILTASNERLVDEVAKFRETAVQLKQDPGQMVELQSLLVKWTSTKNSLAECRRELESKEKTAEEQETKLRSLSDELAVTRNERENLIQELQVSNSKHGYGLEKGGPQDDEHHADMVARSTKASQTTSYNQCGEIDDTRETRDRLQADLSSTKIRLKEIEQDHDTAQYAIQNLNVQLRKMDAMVEQAAQVPTLLQEKCTLVEKLEKEAINSQQLTQSIENYRKEIADQHRETLLSATRLQDAEYKANLLDALKIELEECKKNLSSASHTEQRAARLEVDLDDKSSRIEKLSAEVAQLADVKTALEKSRSDGDRSQADLLDIKYKLETMEKRVTKVAELEQSTKSDEEKIRHLQSKLLDAEIRASAVPGLQARVKEYGESLNTQKAALDKVLRIRSELDETIMKISSHEQEVQRIEECLTRTCVSEQSMDSLHEKIAQRDARIASLEEKPAPLRDKPEQMTSMLKQAGRNSESLDQRQNETTHAHDYHPAPTHAQGYGQQHKARKPADRDRAAMMESRCATSNSESMYRHRSVLGGFNPEQLESPAFPGPRESRHITVIPNSQPSDVGSFRSGTQMRGDEHSSNSLQGSTLPNRPDKHNSFDEKAGGTGSQFKRTIHQQKYASDDEAGGSRSRPDGPIPSQQTFDIDFSTNQEASHYDPPPSSSFGEPLLLEDAENRGWEAQGRLPRLTPPRIPRSGETESLTSPIAQTTDGPSKRNWPSKLPAFDSLGHGKGGQQVHAVSEVADQSPRRLRWSEGLPQTGSSTPQGTVKERHRPNSRAKRSRDETDIAPEERSSQKKRPRRPLSKNEAFGRSEADSYSASPSKSSSGLSKARQSTTSSEISRSTIVGKNAPAPGDGRKGPKKSRGGWKNKKYSERFGSSRG